MTGMSNKGGIFCLAVVLCLLWAAFPAGAEDCGKGENTLAIVTCHQKRYERADKELNAVYAKAMKELTPAEQQKLKEAQRAWLKSRDAGLAFAMELTREQGTFGNIVYADYRARVAEQRVLELKYLMQSPADPPVKW